MVVPPLYPAPATSLTGLPKISQKIAEESQSIFCSGVYLAHDQNFSDVVPGKEELDGGKIAEEILDMAIIENSLQREWLH